MGITLKLNYKFSDAILFLPLIFFSFSGLALNSGEFSDYNPPIINILFRNEIWLTLSVIGNIPKILKYKWNNNKDKNNKIILKNIIILPIIIFISIIFPTLIMNFFYDDYFSGLSIIKIYTLFLILLWPLYGYCLFISFQNKLSNDLIKKYFFKILTISNFPNVLILLTIFLFWITNNPIYEYSILEGPFFLFSPGFRFQGVGSNPNVAAYASIISLIGVSFLILNFKYYFKRNFLIKFLLLFFASGNILTIYLSGVRAAWLSIFISLLLIIFMFIRNNKIPNYIYLFTIFLIFSYILFNFNIFSNYFYQVLNRGSSGGGRLDIWSYYLSNGFQYFFGLGFNYVNYIKPPEFIAGIRSNMGVLLPHNIFIDSWLRGGFIATITCLYRFTALISLFKLRINYLFTINLAIIFAFIDANVVSTVGGINPDIFFIISYMFLNIENSIKIESKNGIK